MIKIFVGHFPGVNSIVASNSNSVGNLYHKGWKNVLRRQISNIRINIFPILTQMLAQFLQTKPQKGSSPSRGFRKYSSSLNIIRLNILRHILFWKS